LIQGRNGGHLLPNAFSGFIARKTTFNTSEAIKSYILEQHNSHGLLKFLKDRNLQDDVDLSEGGHVKLFETLDEEIAERQDFEAAQKAGLDLTAIRWIDNQEFVEVKKMQYFFLRATLEMFFFFPFKFPEIWPEPELELHRRLDPRTQSLALQINRRALQRRPRDVIKWQRFRLSAH